MIVVRKKKRITPDVEDIVIGFLRFLLSWKGSIVIFLFIISLVSYTA